MDSVKTAPTIQNKRTPFYKIVIGIIITLVGIRLLWMLPVARQTFIFLFRPPKEIFLPPLNDPRAIKPETVADIRLLEHWGNGSFNSMGWSPDGQYFVISTTLGVNLYDGQTYQLLRHIRFPLMEFNQYDGQRFQVLRYNQHPFWGGYAFSPDGTVLALKVVERNILLFDLADERIIHQWGFDESIIGLIYLNDGTLVCVTDMRTGGNARRLLKLTGNFWQTMKTVDDDFLLDLAFVPDKQAFVAYYKESVRLIDPVSGREEILPYAVPYGGDFVFAQDTLLSVDRDRSLMSVYKNGILRNSIELNAAIDQPILSPDGNLLATFGPNLNNVRGDSVTFWKIPELEQIRTIWLPDIRPNRSSIIEFSPTGDRLAVLVSNSVVKIYSTEENNTSEIVLNDPYASITDIALTPTGKIRAVSCSGTTVSILEIPSVLPIDGWYFDEPTCGKLLGNGKTVVIAEPYEPQYLYRIGESDSPTIVKGNTFSYDGNVGAASGGINSSGDPVTMAIWQEGFGKQKWSFYDQGSQAFRVAVSPTGQYVAATSDSNTYLWVNGIKSRQTYEALISQITFSPDEKYLASVNGILDLGTGLITRLEVEEGFVLHRYHSTPAFSPDGQILVADVDGTLRFWNTGSGALLTTLEDPDFSIDKLIFSSDGTFLVGLGDGFIKVWGLSNKE